MSGPADALTTPSDAPIIPDLAELVISAMGTILSPTAWIRTVVNWAFDRDPLAEVTKTFAGDWNAVAQASRAYENLAEFVTEVGAEVGAATRRAQADWQGQAADAVVEYMTGSLAPALAGLASSLDSVGSDYRAVAVGMHRTAEGAITLFSIATDWIIFTAAIAAASAASSWTGVGAIVGGGATAAAVAKTITAAQAASNGLTAGQLVLDGAAGLIPGYLGAIHGFSEVDLPAGYDHALVDHE